MHPSLVLSIGCGPPVVRISRSRFRERKWFQIYLLLYLADMQLEMSSENILFG